MPRHAAPAQAQQLSLFDVAVPAAPQPATPSFPPMPVPAAPVAAPVSAPTAAIFRHPQAEREIRLREHLVAYALRRARRRTIGFIVGAEGLAVNAPRWVGIGDIETALHEKASGMRFQIWRGLGR